MHASCLTWTILIIFLYGINCLSMEQLQLVQNAATRLLTGTREYQHISPILISLQWLPIKLRVEFKILILFFKSLDNLAPVYLTELLLLHKPVRSPRSAPSLYTFKSILKSYFFFLCCVFWILNIIKCALERNKERKKEKEREKDVV